MASPTPPQVASTGDGDGLRAALDAVFAVDELADPEDPAGLPLTLHVAPQEWVVVRTSPTRARTLQFALLDLELPDDVPVLSRHTLGRSLPLASRDARSALRRDLGVLIQPDGLIATWTLEENLAFPLRTRGEAESVVEARVARACDTFWLSPWRETRPADLPADVRQCAALARATLCAPLALLLDDPLASVPSRRADVLLAELRARVPAALILVHRRAEALYARADRVGTWDARGWRETAGGAA